MKVGRYLLLMIIGGIIGGLIVELLTLLINTTYSLSFILKVAC